MKKLILIPICLCLIFTKTDAQAVYQGKIVADLYYGGPNFWKSIIKAIYEDDAYYNVNGEIKATGAGPLGLRAEYLVADQIGIGVDVLYVKAGLDVQYQTEQWNSLTQTYETVVYDASASTTKLSIMPSFNYHFGNSENFDGYMTVAAGYKYRNTVSESNDPYEEDVSLRGAAIPVDFRLAVGGRYFFTENIGINGAIGVSGPLISGGLSIRL
jgi:hypothetical protein